VDSFEAGAKPLFYPQIAHTLCISHTVPLWTAWNDRREFLEICGTLQDLGSQIWSNLQERSRALRPLSRTALRRRADFAEIWAAAPAIAVQNRRISR